MSLQARYAQRTLTLDLLQPAHAALTGPHAHLAEVHGGARRYPTGTAPFGAAERGAEGDLHALLRPGESVTLVGEHPAPPHLTRVLSLRVVQMHLLTPMPPPDWPHTGIAPLGPNDMDDMRALVRLTRPGPLRPGAFALGPFWGVREAGQLVALTGTRFQLSGHREITAVCTHPEWRGRGLAARLVAHAAHTIQAEGHTPFLHVDAGNDAAQRVYARLGFQPLRILPIHAYRRP